VSTGKLFQMLTMWYIFLQVGIVSPSANNSRLLTGLRGCYGISEWGRGQWGP